MSLKVQVLSPYCRDTTTRFSRQDCQKKINSNVGYEGPYFSCTIPDPGFVSKAKNPSSTREKSTSPILKYLLDDKQSILIHGYTGGSKEMRSEEMFAIASISTLGSKTSCSVRGSLVSGCSKDEKATKPHEPHKTKEKQSFNTGQHFSARNGGVQVIDE